MENLSQVDQQIFIITDAMEKGDISAPNGYSDIYDQKKGIRIVRLMDRTAPHIANLNDDYTMIKSAAENDKKTRIVNKWISSKISQSYIKIDPSFSGCTFKHSWEILLK
jgi:peptidyl-prolyl cis-trans isomerase SurA